MRDLREHLTAMSQEDLVEYALEKTVRVDDLEEVVLDQQLAHEETVLNNQVDGTTGLYMGQVLVDAYWGLGLEYPEREKPEGERRTPDDQHTLLVLDLDHFTETNARLGHPGANKILKNFGRLLLKNTRVGYDVQVRLHGEEFAVLLPRTSIKNGINVAEKVREAFKASGEGTVSIGVAGVDLSKELDDNLTCADDALYTAKDRGRDQTVNYHTLSEADITLARQNAAARGKSSF